MRKGCRRFFFVDRHNNRIRFGMQLARYIWLVKLCKTIDYLNPYRIFKTYWKETWMPVHTFCDLSNTANLFLATHTAVKPDDLFPSGAKINNKNGSCKNPSEYFISQLSITEIKTFYPNYLTIFLSRYARLMLFTVGTPPFTHIYIEWELSTVYRVYILSILTYHLDWRSLYP